MTELLVPAHPVPAHPVPARRAPASRTAARPSAELRVSFRPADGGGALVVRGPVDRATFPLVRAAVLTAAAGLDALTVDLRRATVHGDDCRLLLAALERRMRRFGRRLVVLDVPAPPVHDASHDPSHDRPDHLPPGHLPPGQPHRSLSRSSG